MMLHLPDANNQWGGQHRSGSTSACATRVPAAVRSAPHLGCCEGGQIAVRHGGSRPIQSGSGSCLAGGGSGRFQTLKWAAATRTHVATTAGEAGRAIQRQAVDNLCGSAAHLGCRSKSAGASATVRRLNALYAGYNGCGLRTMFVLGAAYFAAPPR